MKLKVEILEKAILFAARKHKGQRRKGNGRPYILHPIEVTNILYEVKKSKNMFLLATAAVLHDVVEDCNVSIETILKLFGAQVASIVDELTNDDEKIQDLGKTAYMIEKMTSISNYAFTIKLCDRLANIRDLNDLSQEKKLKAVFETEYILNNVSQNRLFTKTQAILYEKIKEEIHRHKMAYKPEQKLIDDFKKVIDSMNDDEFSNFMNDIMI